MLTSFHNWRQTAGSVTLVLACAFMAGWIRSLSFLDFIRRPFLNKPGDLRGPQVVSHDGVMDLYWLSGPMEVSPMFRVHYWSLAIPLALLSAYLLFSKPRVAEPRDVTEN